MIIDCCRAGAIYSAACEELAEADLNKFMFLVSTDDKTMNLQINYRDVLFLQ